ncbi:hypothetical protein [Janthinobacterium sp.]|uniref:hypothetical protein n=1 Tax=Janthinobacterium sp. TaxID=1871054 RepID=UPI0026349BDA|nr:hypothetical protein [Janthinobacterium sp.]
MEAILTEVQYFSCTGARQAPAWSTRAFFIIERQTPLAPCIGMWHIIKVYHLMPYLIQIKCQASVRPTMMTAGGRLAQAGSAAFSSY